jgi:hypothetical protein
MEPKGSALYSQETATIPYPVPHESTTYFSILLKMHFNIILPSAAVFQVVYTCHFFSEENFVCTSNSMLLTCSAHLIFLYRDEEYQL